MPIFYKGGENLKIEKNSRQVPKTKQVITNKSYHDIVYAYLQVNSLLDENNIRYIDKKQVKFTQIAAALGISRQTVSTKIKGMITMGLIIENNEKGRYELTTLDNSIALLIPAETLRKMTSALSENAINVFIILLNNWFRNNQKSYQFTLANIKENIGISTKTRSNDYIITDILEVLAQLGLISYHLEEAITKECFKTIYRLDNINNKILVAKTNNLF